MGLLTDIQSDIVNSANPTASILRKAQILSYQLENQEFKNWVDVELNGYLGSHDESDAWIMQVPEYRKVPHKVIGDVRTGNYRNSSFPIITPDPSGLPENVRTVYVVQGIPHLEKLIDTGGESLAVPWPDYLVAQVNQDHFFPYGQMCVSILNVFPKNQVAEIIETVRNRLLKFTLELKQAYPNLDKSGETFSIPISDTRVAHIYNVTIAQGGTMSVFDQRNQRVEGDQYNAAGDINFNSIQNGLQFAAELEKLQHHLNGVIETEQLDEEIATDTNYHLTKAIQLSKKTQPDKSVILAHLDKVKGFVQGVTSLAGFAVLVEKAIVAISSIH